MFRNFTIFFIAVVFMAPGVLKAQSVGDTIVVSTFNYNSGTRDTVISFPDNPSLTFEKIIMLYNMRCKDGNVSTGSNRNLGCGEWDYSCNTYITDSNYVDSIWATTPSHKISGFSGSVYDYVTQPYFNKYQYTQTHVVQTVNSESKHVLNTGAVSDTHAIATNQFSGKSQFLYTQAELAAANVDSGNIDGILLTASQSASAKFMRVRVKPTADSVLSHANVDTSGFTQVFFSDVSFVADTNRIQFYTPFVWDGLTNLVFEFSFTNSTPTNGMGLTSETTSSTMGVYAHNQHSFNPASGNYVIAPASNLSGISNEITFSFWAYGFSGVSSTNTVTIFGQDANGSKSLNVHLPWSNSRVYFDCGNTGSSVDRISKLANAADLEGKWNHWAFTKNASTGQMKIYLNGTLFHSGGGKTKPIDVSTLSFGADINGNNLYNGLLKEFRVWKKELTQTEIADWMAQSISSSHPQYADLVAYYPFNEGAGNTTLDYATGTLVANFQGNAIWNYERGRSINLFFKESGKRPKLTVLQGNYTLTTTNTTVQDSLQMVANMVKHYQVFPKTGTAKSDSIGLVSTNTYWWADQIYVYDGITGAVISSTPIQKAGTITIADLDYLQRYPSKFEIMSFVTPYGINLDLGMGGKTWTFDVTDYSPILKGQRRMTMERGGQWQENMDIKFLFIVGTPPRDVKDIQQIWRVDSKSYTAINSNAFFEPRDVMIKSDGSFFKIRSMITGHGQEGEFIPRQHYVKVDGHTNQWQVLKECSFNPVYPQGGTWIYDRAGWCPGMATDLVEWDITSFVTPGQTAEIDYGLSNASGTSNYIVNHQLVSYGSANHSLDVSMKEIINPTSRIEYQRVGSICTGPVIHIQNTGSTTLTSAEITYWLNGSTTPQVFNWTGSLDFMEVEEVNLPVGGLWNDLNGTSEKLYVEVDKPNGGMDEYGYNNHMSSSFTIPDVMPNNLLIRFKTNNVASQNSFEVRDEYNNVVYSQSNFTNNTFHYDTLNLADGCYTFILHDSGNNGISFWATPNDGSGQLQFRRGSTGSLVRNFNGDFGGELRYHFTVNSPLSYEELNPVLETKIYPNPAQDRVAVELENADEAQVTLYSNTGQLMQVPSRQVENVLVINTSALSSGLYYIQVKVGDTVEYHKLVIL